MNELMFCDSHRTTTLQIYDKLKDRDGLLKEKDQNTSTYFYFTIIQREVFYLSFWLNMLSFFSAADAPHLSPVPAITTGGVTLHCVYHSMR